MKRRFVEKQLIDAGKERALFWGWSNIYTYTKSIGEQVLAASGVPFTIVRPAVIESSNVYPFPGWNEGINTSAPFLYMASKGQVQFPADHDCHLDIIPVDMVTSGMIASLAELLDGTARPVYHYGSTDTNACRMTRYIELAGLYKRRWSSRARRRALRSRCRARFESRRHHQEAVRDATARGRSRAPCAALGERLRRHEPRPAAPAAQARGRGARRRRQGRGQDGRHHGDLHPLRRRGRLGLLVRQHPRRDRPHARWRSARASSGSPRRSTGASGCSRSTCPASRSGSIPLIDERMQKRAQAPPRLRDPPRHARRDGRAPRSRGRAPAPRSRGPHPHHLPRARATTPTPPPRASSRSACAPAIGSLLSGQNHPAWPIAYFGILRAGAVAVPVDPALEGPQLANIVRSSGARVALWDAGVEAKGGAYARETFPDLRAFDLDRTSRPATRMPP